MLSDLMRGTIRRATVVAAALAFGACGGDGDPVGVGPGNGGGDEGSFSATVSGDITASFNGTAFHGEATDSGSGDQAWILALNTDDPNSGNSVLVFRLAGRPGTGTYDLKDLVSSGGLEDGEWGAIVTVGQGGGLVFGAFSVSGTVTISSSSESRVQGTFSIQVTAVDPSNPQQQLSATVTGTFDARNGFVVFPGF